MSKKIILSIFVVVAGALAVAVFAWRSTMLAPGGVSIPEQDRKAFTRGVQAGDVVIHITEEGFSPEEVSIKKGETVTWVNDDEDFHWPASDLHPTHEIYSAFDPKEPIGKNETWSFAFDRIGEWRFHDHLRPRWRGMVRVSD